MTDQALHPTTITDQFMLYQSPVWRLAFRKAPRQVRPRYPRRTAETRDPTPRIAVGKVVQPKFVAKIDAIEMIDARIRRIFRGEAAAVIEEVVRARREIWDGTNGREFALSRKRFRRLTC